MQGRLLMGIAFAGKVYYDFTVNLLTLGGECQALELIDELGLPADDDERSRGQKMLAELCFLSQQFKVDSVPQAQMTPQFLLDNLTPTDYVIVVDLLDTLRKKQIAAGESQSNPSTANSGSTV